MARPDSASSSSRNGCQRRWLSTQSGDRPSPPGSCSAAAASMPVAARLAPSPAVPRSTTATARPARASRQATERPISPAPITATSARSGRRSVPSEVAGPLRRPIVCALVACTLVSTVARRELDSARWPDDARGLRRPVQSLRRYEPDQVRRISAPTEAEGPAVQRCLSPLPGISLERPEFGEREPVRQPPATARRAGRRKSAALDPTLNNPCRAGRSPSPRRCRRGGGCRAARDRPTGSRRRASTSGAARTGSC